MEKVLGCCRAQSFGKSAVDFAGCGVVLNEGRTLQSSVLASLAPLTHHEKHLPCVASVFPETDEGILLLLYSWLITPK